MCLKSDEFFELFELKTIIYFTIIVSINCQYINSKWTKYDF